MRKNVFNLALLFFVALFASCIDKDYYYTTEVPEEPKDKSTYTIMMYGCGGGNLDLPMVTNIREALLAGASDRVKFTGQIKFSSKLQEYEETAGTQRFIVGDTPENWYTPVEVLDTDLKLYDPQNLTDFINWSKEQCPADEYILLLWNHGGAWVPSHDAPTNRAVVYDDVLNKEGLTLDDLVKGIKDSGTKMKMIYYDACLMGMVEVLSGLTECADYALAASHITPGIGGDYNSLMYHLNHSTNFEQAIKNYCYETVSHWGVLSDPLDLTFVNLSKMDNLLGEINVFSSYLEEMVQIAAKYNEDPESMTTDEAGIYSTLLTALNNCYQYDSGFPFYDIRHFSEILVNGGFTSYTPKLVDISSRLNRALTEAILCKQVNKTVLQSMNLSLGVTIVNTLVWDQLGYEAAYPGLKFQQATGWGDWISINPYYPTGNPNPDSFISDEDESEGGDEAGGDESDEEDGDDFDDEEGDDFDDEEGDESDDEGEDEHEEGLTQEVIDLILEIIRNR